MAAVDVTISGVIYDKTARTMRPVVIMGEASLTGLGVGGGPMPPQGPVDPGYSPPWAQVPDQPPGQPGVPIHPIWGPPGFNPPGPGMPPGIGGGPIIPDLPPPIDQPPPPADKWSWRYSDDYGWVLVPPGGGGKPQPVP